ncbi:MAG: XrtA system polysaccharide deacetylase [Thermodesulfobacteriota bacterium]
MINALTIDVEDYFHVTAFEKYVKCEDWDVYPSRVENNTLKILEMLDEFSVKATFFILGWVAERCPSVVKEIQKRGHEIACHGYKHKLLYHIGPKNFRKDIRMAKMLLEDICGKEINGYRAPSCSITEESMWALDILIEEGFTYDSSIFPILHDIYGIPNARRFPHEINRPSGVIKEFPMSTLEFRISDFGFRIPISGGGYLRLFPVCLIRKAINHINKSEGQPAVIYFHPWEIDHEQPRIRAGIRSRFRHYINLDKTVGKVKHLLSSFKFAPVGQVLGIDECHQYFVPEGTILSEQNV